MRQQVILCCSLVKNDCIVFLSYFRTCCFFHFHVWFITLIKKCFILCCGPFFYGTMTITDFYSAALSKKKILHHHKLLCSSQPVQDKFKESPFKEHGEYSCHANHVPSCVGPDWLGSCCFIYHIASFTVCNVCSGHVGLLLVIIILEAVESLDITQCSYPFSARS